WRRTARRSGCRARARARRRAVRSFLLQEAERVVLEDSLAAVFFDFNTKTDETPVAFRREPVLDHLALDVDRVLDVGRSLDVARRAEEGDPGVLHRRQQQDTGIAFLGATLDIKGPTYVEDTIHVEGEVIEHRLASKGDRGLVRFRIEVKKDSGETVLEYNPLRLL